MWKHLVPLYITMELKTKTREDAWNTLCILLGYSDVIHLFARSCIKSNAVNDCFHRCKSFTTARTKVSYGDSRARDRWAGWGREREPKRKIGARRVEGESSQKLVSVTYVANTRVEAEVGPVLSPRTIRRAGIQPARARYIWHFHPLTTPSRRLRK